MSLLRDFSSAFCWKLTGSPEIVGVLWPPLGPSLHNLRSILESKQVLAFHTPRSSQVAYVRMRDCSQGLQHAVLPTLPPVLQSQRSELVTLQDRQRSTLQDTGVKFQQQGLKNDMLIKYMHYVIVQKFDK